MPSPTVFFIFAVFGIAGGALVILKKRERGLLMAWAFLAFSLLCFTIALEGPDWLRAMTGIALGVFLLADMIMRTVHKARTPQ